MVLAMQMVQTAGQYLRRLLGGHEDGQDMVEYALIVGVVSVIIVGLFLLAPFGDAFAALAADVCTKISGGAVCT